MDRARQDHQYGNRHQIGSPFRTGRAVVDHPTARISAPSARISTSDARNSTYNVRAIVRLIPSTGMTSSSTVATATTSPVLPGTAKLHRSVVLIDGLFRGVAKAAKGARPLVEHVGDFDHGKAVARYTGPQLGADDLRLLQAVLAVATTAPRTRTGGPFAPLEVRCTLEALGLAAGYEAAGSGGVNKGFKKSLARFAEGGLAWESTPAQSIPSQAILAQDLSGASLPPRRGLARGTGRATLSLVLHPLLASAVRAGRARTHFLQLDMNEVRRLRSDAARLLHHRLCHLNLGEEKEHGVDKLVGYMAGEEASALTRHQWRHDREKLDSALSELERIGWGVSNAGLSLQGIEKKLIRRPAMLASPVAESSAEATVYTDSDLI